MSEKIKMLKLKPPIAGLRDEGETFKYTGFRCPSCNGFGYHRKKKGYHGSAGDEVEKIDCFRCNGSGWLCADVVVRWSPGEAIGVINQSNE